MSRGRRRVATLVVAGLLVGLAGVTVAPAPGVDTGSTDIMELCNELGALYIDTVNEPWLGFYFDASKGPEARSNYALRENTLAAKKARAAGSTTAAGNDRRYAARASAAAVCACASRSRKTSGMVVPGSTP